MIPFALCAIALAAAYPKMREESWTNGVGPLFPDNTTISFYYNPTCVPEPSMTNGILKAEYCTPICYESILIAAVLNNNCTFTIFTGSTSCIAGANSVGEQVRYIIPAGSGQLCIDTSVLDDCESESASGVWSCG
jgi:hypothetical protein